MIGSSLITFTVGPADAPPEAHTVVIPMVVRWSRVDEGSDTDIVIHLRDGAKFTLLRVEHNKARELETVLAKAVEDYYAGRR